MSLSSHIDSHIHLWPSSASNESAHSWMTPGMPLAKPHLLSDYFHATKNPSQTQIEGVVYVETDRALLTPTSDLSTWAAEAIKETTFLRSIVEGHYGPEANSKLLGIVLWAPMDQPTATLLEWLKLAEQTAGPETWRRVKGFRFLLQGLREEEMFREVVLSGPFVENLKILGQRGLSFDIGVDQHSSGAWQLEIVEQAMRKAHEGVADGDKVMFIINHLCKPDFSNHTEPGREAEGFVRWKQAIEKMAKCERTYMKLSGAFSELPETPTAQTDVAAQIEPWVRHMFGYFGAKRVMFGSDWPVCNVNGPKDASPFVVWVGFVERLLQNLIPQVEHQRVWSGTSREAYRLQ
ncbi:L-rhamnono-gamma-lactonase [Oleoguttula sp. CCFEE 5521]